MDSLFSLLTDVTVDGFALWIVLLICVGVFLGSFMDAIAGGGGIITVPTYLIAFSRLPAYYALGTNKLSSGIGTVFSTARFIKNGLVDWKLFTPAVALALAGSVAGTWLQHHTPDVVLKYLLLAVLGAPALIKLGADPLPAHLFILYFGCMSTITPPVALSTYAAAGISGGSPMKTGIYAMKLASVAFLIPYIFVYGQELLLYGSLGSILLAILSASLGCVALAGGMIGWLGAKMPMPLRFVLVGAAITLMIPGALTDVIGVVLMAACVITAVMLSKRQTPKIQ